MYYVIFSKIENALANLPGVAPDFEFVESSAPLEKVCHRPVRAEIEEDVDVLVVLEILLELNHVIVREAPMYLDLAVQLSLLLGCCEFRLTNQFSSKDLPAVNVLELIASGEAAFAEKASLNVSASDPLAIAIQESLLDKRIRKTLKTGCFIEKGHLLIRFTCILGDLLITSFISFDYPSC